MRGLAAAITGRQYPCRPRGDEHPHCRKGREQWPRRTLEDQHGVCEKLKKPGTPALQRIRADMEHGLARPAKALRP